jgi:hypothetical protein
MRLTIEKLWEPNADCAERIYGVLPMRLPGFVSQNHNQFPGDAKAAQSTWREP